MAKPEHYALGSHVQYTHLSAVARKHKPARLSIGRLGAGETGTSIDRWDAVEPEHYRHRSSYILGTVGDPIQMALKELGETYKSGNINKSIVTWEQQGTGIVIALVKKLIGRSVSGSRSSTSYDYGEDFEPGWFETTGEQWLYVVKANLEGMRYEYVKPEHLTLNFPAD